MEQIIGIVALIATLLGVVFALHKITSNQSKNINDNITSSLDNFRTHLDSSLKDQRSEFKEDIRVLDGKLEKGLEQLNSRLDTSSSELKELLYREVTTLKQQDQKLDGAISILKDKTSHVNEELLKFKLTVSEQYERKKD